MKKKPWTRHCPQKTTFPPSWLILRASSSLEGLWSIDITLALPSLKNIYFKKNTTISVRLKISQV